MNKKDAEEALWDDVYRDTLIISDSLKGRFDTKPLDGSADDASIMCTVYYEIPSVGINGKLIGLKRSLSETKISLEIDAKSLGEALSCPEFIRVVVSIDEKVLYETDFVEWKEVSREVNRREGHVELHISLAEHDT